MAQFSRFRLAGFGAAGAIAPDILVLYSKRLTMPSLDFYSAQYLIATGLYVGLAAIVSTIYPYRGTRTDWKAFGTGFALPVILSGLLALQRGPVLAPKGGATIPGTLAELMSLF